MQSSERVTSPKEVRDAVKNIICGLEKACVISDETAFNIRLVMNELLLNSLEHSGMGCATLSCELLDGGLVRLIVSDCGCGFDRAAVPVPKPCATCGRGLLIVESIADRVEYGDGGRRVTAELKLSAG